MPLFSEPLRASERLVYQTGLLLPVTEILLHVTERLIRISGPLVWLSSLRNIRLPEPNVWSAEKFNQYGVPSQTI